MVNILFSSTRQWNPGDEFILFGIRNLLDELGVQYNPLLYNRHPAIHPRGHLTVPQGLLQRMFESPSRPEYDNSYLLESDPSLVDYVIFAGTPEWNEGDRIKPLLEFIDRHRIPCAFLGVGSRKVPSISKSLDRVLRRYSDVIVARNQSCYEGVREYSPSALICCPALFCAQAENEHTSPDKVGLVVQDKRTQWHHVTQEVFDFCLEVYPDLAEHFTVELIAHYIDDLEMANRYFPSLSCRYSSYAEDYLDIYSEFDLIIGPRVHGSGLASSLGIPNILLPHDGRSGTAHHFGSIIEDPPANLLETINQLDLKAISRSLIQRKQKMRERYLTLLSKTLSITPDQNGSVRSVKAGEEFTRDEDF